MRVRENGGDAGRRLPVLLRVHELRHAAVRHLLPTFDTLSWRSPTPRRGPAAAGGEVVGPYGGVVVCDGATIYAARRPGTDGGGIDRGGGHESSPLSSTVRSSAVTSGRASGFTCEITSLAVAWTKSIPRLPEARNIVASAPRLRARCGTPRRPAWASARNEAHRAADPAGGSDVPRGCRGRHGPLKADS